jgi:hypothetical protein
MISINSDNAYIFQCLHCNELIQVYQTDIACGIFRHGIFKDGNPVPPHTPKNICDQLYKEKKIFGCGKPFQIIKKENNKIKIMICDYI